MCYLKYPTKFTIIIKPFEIITAGNQFYTSNAPVKATKELIRNHKKKEKKNNQNEPRTKLPIKWHSLFPCYKI